VRRADQSRLQKALGNEARVAVRDEHVRQPHVAKYGGDEVARGRAVAGVLKVGTSHTRQVRRSIGCASAEVVTGAGWRELEEVQADAA
jgi:hypothetical protein